MRLYGCSGTRSIRSLWAAEEAQATYDYVHVDLKKGEARQSAFLQINPGGKVPALVDGNLILTESAAICMHIADKYPQANLMPAVGTTARSACMQWSFFALSELEQPLWTLAKHTFALPEKYRVPAIMDTARWEFARAANVLVTGLGEREFILGDSFSVADILLTQSLGWARHASLDLPAPLVGYVDRMFAREAYRRALMREKAA